MVQEGQVVLTLPVPDPTGSFRVFVRVVRGQLKVMSPPSVNPNGYYSMFGAGSDIVIFANTNQGGWW